MAATKVFSMENNFSQTNGSSIGICTAASFAWVRKCLKLGRGVRSFSEIGTSQHLLSFQMATLRKYDSDPEKQTTAAGLEIVGQDITISTADDLLRHVKTTQPYTAIFWTSGHTMAYRYARNEMEFFDIEDGLYRSRYARNIKNAINKNYRGALRGCRIVKLQNE